MSVQLPPGLLLDLDDTIISFDQNSDTCWSDVCGRFSGRIGQFTGEQLFLAIQQKRRWFWGNPELHKWGRFNMDAARCRIVLGALTVLGMDNEKLAEEIACTYAQVREQAISPFPGAVETLLQLRRLGVKLALVTNGSAGLQRGKIERFQLTGLFDSILIEGEVGFGKPDERIYRLALEELSLEPDQAWMIGDNLDWEVAAPQRLGIRGVWIDHRGDGPPSPGHPSPFRIIRSLAAILHIS